MRASCIVSWWTLLPVRRTSSIFRTNLKAGEGNESIELESKLKTVFLLPVFEGASPRYQRTLHELSG